MCQINVTIACRELKLIQFMYGFSTQESQGYCWVLMSVAGNPRGLIKQSVEYGRSISEYIIKLEWSVSYPLSQPVKKADKQQLTVLMRVNETIAGGY